MLKVLYAGIACYLSITYIVHVEQVVLILSKEKKNVIWFLKRLPGLKIIIFCWQKLICF
jgi:hypothetical protein